MGKYLAGVDVGTTGTRCMIFNQAGEIVGSAYFEYKLDTPKPGWIEQDLEAIIAQTKHACKEAVADSGVDPKEIVSVGFSTQRSCTIPIDENGKTVRPMMSWMDSRTGAEVADMMELIDGQEYYDISGMPGGTTWLITKVLWMRKNEPENYKKVYKFVQQQDTVLKAFGADDYYTDLPDMAFYGIWDTGKVEWSKKLCDLFEVTPDMFGKPIAPGTKVAEVDAALSVETGFAVGTAVVAGAGDQNCGVLGMGGIKGGIATVTLGTAGLGIISLDEKIPGVGGLMNTNHVLPGMWEAEGLTNAAASSYRWFRDVVGTAEVAAGEADGKSAFEYLNDLAASSKPGANGVLYLPYLATAATPRWNPNSSGAYLGLTFATTRGDLTRATMEGPVMEIRDIMDSWLKTGVDVKSVRLGGGATKSHLWNQIQADVYGKPVDVMVVGESTVLGAAILGGVGAGVYKDAVEGVDKLVAVSETLQPNMENHAIYEELYEAYCAAYDGLAAGAFDKLMAIKSK